jgi:hypothetical protein
VRNKHQRRHFTVTIPEELWESFRSFMAVEQYHSEPAAAIALIRMCFAANPADGLKMSTRSQVYNEVKTKTLRLVSRSLVEIAAILKMETEDANQG